MQRKETFVYFELLLLICFITIKNWATSIKLFNSELYIFPLNRNRKKLCTAASLNDSDVITF